MTDQENLIYDWNTIGTPPEKPTQKLEFDDETLRDGLQSPSVLTPSIDQKIEILRRIDSMGLDTADIGLPGAGGVVKEDTLELARAMVGERMNVKANCAARTVVADIEPILEIIEKTARPIEACLFIGSSPIRQYAEDWTMNDMLKHTREAVSFATRNAIDVMYVTEDTTRAHPEDLKRLYFTAIECGAKRICLCDTCGHSTPNGVFQLVTYMKKLLKDFGMGHIKVDFHGHNDRGLGVWNAITAFMAGADRVHGSALGIGERVGNCAMDQLLVNLKLLGWIDNDLTSLYEYCKIVSESTEVAIPHGYPVVGKDAFETATGVHASAVIKAIRKGDKWLADRVYSGVPAGDFGREQVITIGPMSGKSNVAFWLEKRGRETKAEVIDAIMEKAKSSNRLLTDEEIEQIIGNAS
ncbi:MAG: LeuA family protein [Planctomycetota bacterium]|nr:LeuA family protein [Planctomycetota bacterium]